MFIFSFEAISYHFTKIFEISAVYNIAAECWNLKTLGEMT
jgi:hypothetical protein